MASGLGPNPSQEMVEDEILFQNVILDSLDKSAFDYESRKREVQDELRTLHKMLADSQQHTGAAPHPLTTPDNMRHASSSSLRNQGFGVPGVDTPPTANASSASSASFAVPRIGMPLKRPLEDQESHYDAPSGGSSLHRNAKRATPSPAPTVPGTPDSLDSLEASHLELHSLTAVDPAARALALERRREQERKILEELEQIRKDEQLARQLQQDPGIPVRPAPSSQNKSQTVFNANGSVRKLPDHRSSASTPAHGNRYPAQPAFAGPSAQPVYGQIKPEQNNFNQIATPMNQSIKRERPPPPSQPVRPLAPEGNDSDDSDIQVISADDFRASGGRPSQRPRVPGAFPSAIQAAPLPQYGAAGQANVPGYQGYPGYPIPQQSWQAATADRVKMALWNAQQTLKDGSGSAITGLRQNFDQLTELFTGRPNPYDSASASRYNGLGYEVDPARPSSSIPYNPRDVIQIDDEDDGYSRYNHIYMSPEAQQEELQKLISNIQASDDSDPALREPTPEAMREELYPHQRVGLSWMKKMEEGSNRGGILADDMGLGKTIQALALMVSRPSQDPRRKTTLIIAPVALMRQWATEITTKLRSGRHQLSIWIHHGPAKAKKNRFRDLQEYDVVLTTFGTLAQELKKQERWNETLKRNPDAVPTAKERLTLLGEDCLWYRIIIDEAQCIKNRATQSSKAATVLYSIYRWCMTGTPMMNGIEDLYAQLRFLRIGPFNDWHRFRQQFILGMTRSMNEVRRENSMRQFQALLKAILLRRTKTSEIDGKPILQLPPRIVEINHAIFSEDEDQFYKGVEQKAQVTVNAYLREGTVMRHYSNILVLLLRLRQACCHPHLIKDYAQAVNIEGIPEEDRIALAQQFTPDVVERIIAANGEFECPVCYDGTQNPALMFPCGHDTCSECFAKITDPSAAIANGDENGQAKCPQCRQKADPNKVVDYQTFKKVHQPELWAQEHPEVEVGAGSGEEDANDNNSDSESNNDDEDDDAETDSETESLGGFIVNDDEVDTDDDDNLDRKPRLKKEKFKGKGKAKSDKPKKSKKGKGKAKQTQVTLAELKKLAQRNKKSKVRYLRRLREDWITSAKIEKTLEILRATRENDPTEKTIIFSQFTSMLDLLEVAIEDLEIRYERYDGSMNAGMRADAVHTFMTKSNCKLMLVSLKAGNAGLNLTAASQVIILDPFWNPFVEEQAIDRAHRIGQRREVRIHRVLIKGTVEDRIIELQEKKREIIGTALDEGANKDLSRLGVNQIRFLFGLGGGASARG